MGVPNTHLRWNIKLLRYYIIQVSTSLNLVSINLYVSHLPPEIISLEVKSRGSSSFSLVQAYVLDDQNGSCEEFDVLGVPCSNYTVGTSDISGNTNIIGLSCPLDVPLVRLMVFKRIISVPFVIFICINVFHLCSLLKNSG